MREKVAKKLFGSSWVIGPNLEITAATIYRATSANNLANAGVFDLFLKGVPDLERFYA